MSRSGYSDDCDGWELIRWRGAVKSAVKGARGQALLRETLAALEAMPVKELIAHELMQEGEFCTLGVVGNVRGIDMKDVDQEDRYAVAKLFNIAPALAAEIVFENDECVTEWYCLEIEICGPMQRYQTHRKYVRTPAHNVAAKRWHHMHAWVKKNLKEAP